LLAVTSMAQRLKHAAALIGVTVMLLPLVGCASESATLKEHAQKLRSLRATAVSVSEAWSAGDVSETFARLTLEQAFELVQKERAAIAPTAQDLANPPAAALARDSDDLERQIAALVRRIETTNAGTGSNRPRLTDAHASIQERP